VSITLPPQLTSKLTAVNVLLQSIGETPVNTLEETESVDVLSAVAAIDEVTLKLLTEGWHWNREYGLTLNPEEDGSIPLPSTCLFLGQAYWNGHRFFPAPITERGRKLYDTENHTYTFTKAVEVDMLVHLEWEEMPEYARTYITIRAAQLFQGRLQSSSMVFRIQQDEVESARATIEQREAEANPDNQITGNRQMLTRLGGRNMRRRQN
jgi:hypothetical protein